MKSIAIVGGGPAGAYAGELLASAGWPVTILDEHLAWEKPCGGGLSAKALERYPFLVSENVPRRLVEKLALRAPNGASVSMRLRRPMAIFSRRALNGLLLDRARRAGAAVVRDRVLRAERRNGAWRLHGKEGSYEADFCVAAAGARNPFRQMGAQMHPGDAYIALGFYVPALLDQVEIQFLRGLEGYIWIFPRSDHLSVGICGRLASHPTLLLRRWLETYMGRRGLPLQGSAFYCHLLPSLSPAGFRRHRVAGDGWAAVGDAAGLVDPLTGEGLFYAMRSSECLAGCLRTRSASAYPAVLRREMTADLEMGAALVPRFYNGRFLLGGVTTRMVQFCRRSPAFRDLMQDLVAGSQDYLGLRARLLRQLGVTLWEIAASFASGPGSDPHEPFPVSTPV